MPVKVCAVSFTDVRGIKHTAEIEAETLYEAAVQGIRRLNQDPWIERIGPATALEIVTFQSEDHREALAALREKREPVFKGR